MDEWRGKQEGEWKKMAGRVEEDGHRGCSVGRETRKGCVGRERGRDYEKKLKHKDPTNRS